jgi:branched-subunit amino acid transport protein
MTIWVAVIAAGIGCYLLKLAGLSLPPRALEHPVIERIADLIPVALLAALVAVQVLGGDGELVLDARLAGLATAFVLLLRMCTLEGPSRLKSARWWTRVGASLRGSGREST